MLDVSPSNLIAEIEHAEEERDRHISSFKAQVERYHGPYYRQYTESHDMDDFYPENHYYAWISHFLAEALHGNPRVKIGTRLPGAQKETARALRLGANRWIRDTNFRRLLEKIAVDYAFKWGVAMVSQSRQPGQYETEDPLMWPQVVRLSPFRFGWDPVAESWEESRFAFHKYVADKDDLLRAADDDPDAGWIPKEIKALQSGQDADNLYKGSRSNGPERNQVLIREIWVPEFVLPESEGPANGFHGTIFTLGQGNAVSGSSRRAGFVREARPFYGPRWGPYHLLGTFSVPDKVEPLGTLTAVEGQNKDLNDHARASSESASRYKRLVLVDAKNPRLVQQIKDARHDFVVPIHGLEKDSVIPLEIGGITDQMLAYLQVARDRLDRNSGLDEVQQGEVARGATATAVAEASAAGAKRMGWIKGKFTDGVRRILQSVVWYLYHDDQVIFPLGSEAVEEYGMDNPFFVGGAEGEGSGMTFDDLELEIEPFSMERTSAALQQRQTMLVFEMLTNVAPLIPNMPWINWKEIFDKLGEGVNMPHLGELVNVDLAMQFAGMEGGEGPKEGEGLLGRQLGSFGQRSRLMGGSHRPKNSVPGETEVNGVARAGKASGREQQTLRLQEA